jgi:phosphopantetheinyl transferase (holo-ACP synthase)
LIIGNDIVDLVEAGVPSPRFVARVLGPGERGHVWRRWAAKEAAYKVLARRLPDLPFAHARFVVDLEERVVRHPAGDVRVRWEQRAGAVACVGWQGSGDVLSASETIEEAEAGAAGPLGPREAARGRLSVAVRLLAKRLLCRRLGHEWASLEVARPQGGPPEVWWRGARLPGVQISLSHDGRFVACAIALEAS